MKAARVPEYAALDRLFPACSPGDRVSALSDCREPASVNESNGNKGRSISPTPVSLRGNALRRLASGNERVQRITHPAPIVSRILFLSTRLSSVLPSLDGVRSLCQIKHH